MKMSIGSIVSNLTTLLIVAIIPLSLLAIKNEPFQVRAEAPLTPPITPPFSPTPTPQTGSFSVNIDPYFLTKTCLLSDPNCWISVSYAPVNRTGQRLYNTTIWTSNPSNILSYIGFDGNWTTGTSKLTERAVEPGFQAINTSIKITPPHQVGTYYATIYIDGQTCNQLTTPPDCIYYGGTGTTFSITVVESGPTPTPTPRIETGSYKLSITSANEISCTKGDPNCGIYTSLKATNRSGVALYDSVVWVNGTGISVIGFDGLWTSGQSKTTRVVNPGEELINTLVKVVPPANQAGTFYAYAYADGRPCNSVANCSYLGGGSQYFKITVVEPSPTATALPTATPIITIAPTPYLPTPVPTVAPTQTPAPTFPTYTVTPVPTATPTPVQKTITVKVNSGADDAYESADINRKVTVNSSDLKLGWYTGFTGLRFTGNSLNGLKGKKILSAKLEVTSTANSNAFISMRIFAQNSGVTNPFVASQANISSRVKTSSSVVWTPTEKWVNSNSKKYQSPELSSLINEVVNRSDYDGKSLVILLQNYGSKNYAERIIAANENWFRDEVRLVIKYQ